MLKNNNNVLLLYNYPRLLSSKVDGMESYVLFELSFWRHPFTVEQVM